MSHDQQITLSISTLSALAVIALFLACVHGQTAEPQKPQEVDETDDVPASAPVTAPAASVAEPPAAAPVVTSLAPAEPVPGFSRITTPLFPESPDRVIVSKTTWARAAPFADAGRLGLVSGRASIRVLSHVVNEECETPWIEVAPHGFICVAVAPVVDGPKAAKTAKKTEKKKGKGLIGSYAIAAKGARFYKNLDAAKSDGRSRPARGDMLRRGQTVTLPDGRTFWKTQRGEYIESTSVRRLWGSKWKGVDIDAAAAPIAFAVDRRSVRAKVIARRRPSASAAVARRLSPRAVVSVHEISGDGAFARIGDSQWVARADLREVETREPPEGVDAGGVLGRWADVDLDKQLVVLYDGKTPVFATLMSSGRKSDRTPTGLFRVTRKKLRTTMASDRSRRQTYSAAVPYSTYFYEGIAFHTAYWHDSFGVARSHGCVNLSPADARTVYDYLGPELPEGWSVVYGHETQRGSVVNVRAEVPNPIPDPVVAATN